MPTIKFSSNYHKLHGQTTAELLAVKDIKIDRNTSPELLEYDTKKPDGTYYELKKGEYIQLLFIGNLGIPFCTIRSKWSKFGDKKDFYLRKIGETFKIEVKENE